MSFLQEYEKIERLGKGSFASVWKVRHEKLRYIRALKVSNELVEDENDPAYQSFLNECKVLLQIGNGSHPNIVHIYQPRLIENRAVVEMDYVDGETLEKYLKHTPFIEIDEFYRFFENIVGALAYCHHDIFRYMMDPNEDDLESDPNDGSKFLIDASTEKRLAKKYGVTHNDIHSGNVMRRNLDGNFILLDFGLAIQDGRAVKSSARRGGALEYMSPEKFDDSSVITTQSDVYSLGILLFEMLAGRVPFQMDPARFSSNPTAASYEIMTAHKQAVPPPIEPLRREAFEKMHLGQQYVKDYPLWLENLILKCLAKEPQQRFSDAKELLEEYKKLKGRKSYAPRQVNNTTDTAPYIDTLNINQSVDDNNSENHSRPVTHPPLPEDKKDGRHRIKTNPEPPIITPPPLPLVDDSDGRNHKEPPKKKKSHTALIIIPIALAALALLAWLGFKAYGWYNDWEDSKHPHRYICATSLKFRSSQDSLSKSNIIDNLPYGTKLTVLDEGKLWCRVSVKTDNGKLTGYVSSYHTLDSTNFYLLNGILSNDNSRKLIATTRCRKALINYFKNNNWRGEMPDSAYKAIGKEQSTDMREEWTVWCYPPKSQYNSVKYCKEYDKNSKYDDFIVILSSSNFQNLKRLVYFHFDNDGRCYKVYEDYNPESDRIESVSVGSSIFTGEKYYYITYY